MHYCFISLLVKLTEYVKIGRSTFVFVWMYSNFITSIAVSLCRGLVIIRISSTQDPWMQMLVVLTIIIKPTCLGVGLTPLGGEAVGQAL